jgi:hypothetical protein
MKQAIALFLLFVGIHSVNGQTKFSEKVGGHQFKLSIPDYMVKTYELNDVASLQYQNTTKEAYVIVIEDPKDQLESLGIKFTDAKNFLDEFVKDYKTENDKRSTKNASQFNANGNNCAQLELYWSEEDGDFFMLITAVESKTHFYKILCWTILEKAPDLKKDFLAIAKSLKD